jgi:hypothetical protein
MVSTLIAGLHFQNFTSYLKPLQMILVQFPVEGAAAHADFFGGFGAVAVRFPRLTQAPFGRSFTGPPTRGRIFRNSLTG